ncbi:hypothetical protein [Mesorhizobium sp.]|uniref:hypothetical protein n=1 Tax=Mesorhizobium sp. TaxID=1871066 RepID=UPI0011FC5217|nr:hypothetical protein [Mesorhizobium sp.]TIS48103.1 MAG: hypothetical protein E5W96_20615 [Mesorhizobium sp.]
MALIEAVARTRDPMGEPPTIEPAPDATAKFGGNEPAYARAKYSEVNDHFVTRRTPLMSCLKIGTRRMRGI